MRETLHGAVADPVRERVHSGKRPEGQGRGGSAGEVEEVREHTDRHNQHTADLDRQPLLKQRQIVLSGDTILKSVRKGIGNTLGLLGREVSLIPQRPREFPRIERYRAHDLNIGRATD